ncbi:hypothetical protein HMPREF2701_02140 [Streptococcus sp. HMSC077D04]|nr:hypothetical protein HMPREF2701_02140 [Streptococcus sp. HMSC077D04]
MGLRPKPQPLLPDEAPPHQEYACQLARYGVVFFFSTLLPSAPFRYEKSPPLKPLQAVIFLLVGRADTKPMMKLQKRLLSYLTSVAEKALAIS